MVRTEPDGTTRTVAELGPGDFFGELALLTAAPRNATSTGADACCAWSLERRDFDDLLRQYLRMDDVLQTVAQSAPGERRRAAQGRRPGAETG